MDDAGWLGMGVVIVSGKHQCWHWGDAYLSQPSASVSLDGVRTGVVDGAVVNAGARGVAIVSGECRCRWGAAYLSLLPVLL